MQGPSSCDSEGQDEDILLAKHLPGILHLAPQIWPHSSCCRSKPRGHRLKSQSAGGAVVGSWVSSHHILAN